MGSAATLKVRPKPFPHMVLDGLWNEDVLLGVLTEFPDARHPGWVRYSNDRELKLEGGRHLWGAHARQLFKAVGELGPELARAFGMPDLILREIGGGYHQIEPGGRLDIHADFNRSSDGLYRRLNVLIYLNSGWKNSDGGHIELHGDGGPVKILPIFNRTLIFETSDKSFHGHPIPLPGPRSRRSFAAYFFSKEPPAEYSQDHSTLWYSEQQRAGL